MERDRPVFPDELERKDEYLIDNGAYLFKELVKSTHGNINSFRIFSLKELQKATDNFNFNSRISANSHHSTYRGKIEDKDISILEGIIEDRHVTVKTPRRGCHTMVDEVVCLSLIEHRNVVKLLGCCIEAEALLVVHELPPFYERLEENFSNGTLEEYLENTPVELLWTDRLRIATEIADAVAYLHSALHITHRRLWDPYIIFDEFHSAKLCAFDYSEIQKQTGSSDVETNNRNKLRKREDVDDFGKILLNLLGIENHDIYYNSENYKEKGEILKYLMLNVSQKEMPQVEAYIDLLLRCRRSSFKRMKEIVLEDELSMEEVVRELRRIRSMMNLSSGANASSYHEVTSDY